jgi:hypothetical protein
VNSKVEVKGGKDASKRKKKKINKYPSDDSDTAEDDESDHAQPHCRRKSKRRSGSDQDAQKEQRKMATKPDKYDGKTPFCSFLAKFESCCEYNAWDERDKAAHLRNYLVGDAAQLL